MQLQTSYAHNTFTRIPFFGDGGIEHRRPCPRGRRFPVVRRHLRRGDGGRRPRRRVMLLGSVEVGRFSGRELRRLRLRFCVRVHARESRRREIVSIKIATAIVATTAAPYCQLAAKCPAIVVTLTLSRNVHLRP